MIIFVVLLFFLVPCSVLYAEDSIDKYNQVESLLNKHAVTQAEDLVAKWSAAGPDSPELHTALGEIAFRRGRPWAAQPEFKRAIKLNPHFSRAWVGLGRVYSCAFHTKTAYVYYRQAHEVDPHDLLALHYWAETLHGPAQMAAFQNYLELAKEEDSETIEHIQ
jgi:Tfp pilus assembly protein PilF